MSGIQKLLMVWAALGRRRHQVALGLGTVEEVGTRVRAHGKLRATGVGIIPPGANMPRVLGTLTTATSGVVLGGLLMWQVISAAIAG